MAAVAEYIAEKYGLGVAELRGQGRARHIAWPRQEAFAMCRALGRSLAVIGRHFGGRDHTTVRYGIIAHENRSRSVTPQAASGQT